MQIEAGKYYRTRGGDVVGPMRQGAPRSRYPWETLTHCWTKGGAIFAEEREHIMDLISEVYVSDTPPAVAPAPETKTLRDEAANAALTGLLAKAVDDGSMGTEDWASDAYLFADAMMEARKK